MMDPIVIVALVAAVASVIGSAIVALSSRGKTRVDYKAALDARIDARVTQQLNEAWARIDKQDRTIQEYIRLENIAWRYTKKLHAWARSGATGTPPDLPPELVSWHDKH